VSGNIPSVADRLLQAGVAVRDTPEGAGSRRARPLSFAVTASQNQGEGSGLKHGRGELQISPDAIAFVPFNPSDEIGELAHGVRSLMLTKVRLARPSSNTFLMLGAPGCGLRISVSALTRRKLRRALQDCAVSVQEGTVWRAPSAPGCRADS
jgi:hypothetical protein